MQPTPRPTSKPQPTFVDLIKTPSPEELAIILHAQAQVTVVNEHIADINAALKSESRRKLRAAAEALGAWAKDETAWLKSHPASSCVAVPYGYYQDVVEAFAQVSKSYLRLLNETDPELMGLWEVSIGMNWNVANGALQLLQAGLISARASC